MDQLSTTSDAARVLNGSAACIRGYERDGKLPAQRTSSGQRLFRATDVDRLAKELRDDQ